MRDRGLEGASDNEQLLVAAQRNRVFVTRNERDFILLHDAWQRWGRAWGVTVTHPGVLILPQGTRYGVFWDAERITGAILTCLTRCSPLTNGIFRWKVRSWQRRIGKDWINCS